MLKSFQHHRSSSSSSPVLQHYAPTSQSSPTSPLPRRGSKLKVSIAKFTPFTPPQRPQKSQYVDAATQWSPRIILKMDSPRAEPVRLKKELKDQTPAPAPKISPPPAKNVPTTIPAKLPPSPSKPILQPESPGLKRRSSRDAPVPVVTTSQPLPTKRARGDSVPVKILPLKYEFCPVEDMVVLIANMVQELIQANDQLPPRTVVLTRFHSRTPPGISVVDYLQRLAKHATLTPPILLSMVYYIDRLCLLYPAFTINTLTVHRFLITAATVASKGLSDAFWNNATYARVGGIKIAELGLLELDFLYRVDWKIVPNPEALVDYYKGLIERSPGYQLESDDSELDEDSGDEEKMESSDEMEAKKDVAGQAATNQKWKAWMDDVEAKRGDGGHDDKQT